MRLQTPESALFRLPIFQDSEVIDWMQDVFPSEFELANRDAGQINLENIQSEMVAEALHATHARLDLIQRDLATLTEVMLRRTNLLTPSKGVSGVVFTGERSDDIHRVSPYPIG